ncbi:MAG: c-type cytochrome [Gammaproteobacteria bacterium]|nr:c-type cytochrome [Gammaproteobacteria bacterium]
MRTLIFLVLSAAVTVAACKTTAPPAEEIPAAETSSSACIDNLDWAYTAKRGETMYNSSCAYCHGKDGRGQAGQVPALAGNAGLAADPDRGIRLLLVTQAEEGRFHGMEYDDMIAILGELNENDLSDVMTYALSSWGNCAGPITPERILSVSGAM